MSGFFLKIIRTSCSEFLSSVRTFFRDIALNSLIKKAYSNNIANFDPTRQ